MRFPGDSRQLFFAAIVIVFAASAAFLHLDGADLCGDCNIVYISIEPMNPDHMSVYGHDRDTTPYIDQLAENSFVFTRAFAQSSHTTPSLYSTFSSRYPSDHDVRPATGGPDGNLTMMAEFLKDRGYRTFSINSGSSVGGDWGFDDGFDRYSEHYVNESHHQRYHEENGTRTDFVERQVEKTEGKFFLYYQSFVPHDPYIQPDRYTRLYGPQMPEFRQESRSYREELRGNPNVTYSEFRDYYFGRAERNETVRRYIVSQYDGSLRRADNAVKELIELLKEEGEYENTLIIVNSQHGEQFGEHSRWRHDTSLYNEVIRVPLIIRFPGQERGERIDSYVGNVDIFPTVAAAVEGEIPDRLRARWRGESLLPVMFEDGDSDGIVFAERSLGFEAFLHQETGIKRYENSSGVFYFNISRDFEESDPVPPEDTAGAREAYQRFIERRQD